MEEGLKQKTVRTLKWNTIDRVSSQLIYAVTGVILANILSPEDFGLVGALLVFQAFAILFVDSGFGAALLQRKAPTEKDYTTVFWFNLFVSILIYTILYLSAPLIADIFQGDHRLIPLSRVMFLTFILNGLSIVQTNRLMKQMDVKRIAVANIVGLVVSGAIGIRLALSGAGAWALVWQYIAMAAIKTIWLWLTGGWFPRTGFHLDSLKKIWRIGLSVFSSSALNTLFQYIYSLIIGAFYTLTSLGFYTQADKWSKMGSASISQIMTSSFVPLLSKVQDDSERFNRYVTKINRFSGFLLFPVMIGIGALGQPLFHALFGSRWDAAIILFQILTIRGIFVVLISLYSNYLLALGYGKRLFIIEAVKDLMIILAVISTVWFNSVPLLVWGQFWASLATYAISLWILCKATGFRPTRMLCDLLPSFFAAAIASVMPLIMIYSGLFDSIESIRLRGCLQLVIGFISGFGIYLSLCHAFRIGEMSEAFAYLFRSRQKH